MQFPISGALRPTQPESTSCCMCEKCLAVDTSGLKLCLTNCTRLWTVRAPNLYTISFTAKDTSIRVSSIQVQELLDSCARRAGSCRSVGEFDEAERVAHRERPPWTTLNSQFTSTKVTATHKNVLWLLIRPAEWAATVGPRLSSCASHFRSLRPASASSHATSQLHCALKHLHSDISTIEKISAEPKVTRRGRR